MLDSDLFSTESASLPITLEIYRLENKPNSLSDFDENLYKSINLKMPNYEQTYTNISITDKVLVNKKYFYFFRVVNQAGNFGIGSSIIEAELVSDGGYKFGKFKSYTERQLEPPPLSRTIKGFKKLLNVSPNISNLIIDDSNVDYADLAENQLENITFGTPDNNIWDKKFKIRLTSKKTGKKIDINITHKLVG